MPAVGSDQERFERETVILAQPSRVFRAAFSMETRDRSLLDGKGCAAKIAAFIFRHRPTERPIHLGTTDRWIEQSLARC
jgi:hypothetical protein